MLYEMMSATEYGILKGFSEKSTRVHQIIRSGNFPAEWVQAPKKIGNQWIVFVDSKWIKDVSVR